MLLEGKRIFFINHQTTAIGKLGLAAGPVGGGDHILAPHARLNLDQADRATHIKSLAPHPVGAGANVFYNTPAHMGRPGDRGVRKNNHKLVPAHPAQVYALGQHVGDALAHLLQHFVPYVMPEQIIDQLEAVQIQIGERHGLPVRELLHGRIERFFDATAVQHLGERIMVSQKIQLLGGFGLVGDILQGALNLGARQRGLDQKTLGTGAPGVFFCFDLQLNAAAVLGVVGRIFGLVRLLKQLLVEQAPGPSLKILVPVFAAFGQHLLAQHLHQGRVGAQKAPLNVQGEHANRYGLEGLRHLGLHLQPLRMLLAHLLGNCQGSQKAGRQGRSDTVDRVNHALDAKCCGDDFRETGQQGHRDGRGIPPGRPGASFLQNADHQKHQGADDNAGDAPHHR